MQIKIADITTLSSTLSLLTSGRCQAFSKLTKRRVACPRLQSRSSTSVAANPHQTQSIRSLNGTFLVTPVYLHRGASSFTLGHHHPGTCSQHYVPAQVPGNGDRRQAGVDCERARMPQESESADVLPAEAEAVPSSAVSFFTSSTGR